jgi:nucleotide-binding universal stress UspA family protein
MTVPAPGETGRSRAAADGYLVWKPRKDDAMGDGGERVRRVLVAIDESDASERVIAFVNEFFDDLDVEVLAVNVAPLPSVRPTAVEPYGAVIPWPWMYRAASETVPATADDARRHAQQTLIRSDLREDEVVAEVGEPAEAIVRAADDHDASLVVVGHNHRNLLERLFEGSVSRQLLRHTERPVLVVP